MLGKAVHTPGGNVPERDHEEMLMEIKSRSRLHPMPVRLQGLVLVEERSHWDIAGPMSDCFMRERKLYCERGEEKEVVKIEKMERKERTEARGMVRCAGGCVLGQWSLFMVGWCNGEGMRGCIYGDKRLGLGH